MTPDRPPLEDDAALRAWAERELASHPSAHLVPRPLVDLCLREVATLRDLVGAYAAGRDLDAGRLAARLALAASEEYPRTREWVRTAVEHVPRLHGVLLDALVALDARAAAWRGGAH